MELKGNSTVVIEAPLEQVWEVFRRFEDWPNWCVNVKEVRREAGGIRFVYRGAQDVEFNFVLRMSAIKPWDYIQFETVEEAPHNANVHGQVKFAEEEGGTRVTLFLEGTAETESGVMNKLAEAWAYLFVEHDKNLKVILQDLKAYFEGNKVTPPVSTEAV